MPFIHSKAQQLAWAPTSAVRFSGRSVSSQPEQSRLPVKPYLIPHFLPEISARLYERKRRPLRWRRAAEAWRRAGSVRRRSLLRTNAVCFLVERWRPRCTRVHQRSTSRRRAPAQPLVLTAASKSMEPRPRKRPLERRSAACIVPAVVPKDAVVLANAW